jgi:hypothetical protein
MLKFQYVFPQCNVGQTFSARLSLSILPPLVIVGTYVFLYIVTQIASKIVPLIKPLEVDSSVNVTGMLLQVMYVMQCKDAFAFFASRDNPSNKETLTEFSDVVLWSDEHVSAGAILITTYLWLVYVIGTYSAFTWIVFNAKQKVREQSFRRRYRFVLARWRPDCVYWGLLMLGRNLLIALIPICIRTDEILQTTVFVMLLAIHALGEARVLPWRAFTNNLFEILVSVLLILMGIVGLVFQTDASDDIVNVAAVLVATLFFSVWIICLGTMAHAVTAGSPARRRAKTEVNVKTLDQIMLQCNSLQEAMKSEKKAVDDWIEYVLTMDDYQTLALGVAARFFSEFHSQNPLCKRYTRKLSQLEDMAHIAMEELAMEELGAQPNETAASKDKDEHPSEGEEVLTI